MAIGLATMERLQQHFVFTICNLLEFHMLQNVSLDLIDDSHSEQYFAWIGSIIPAAWNPDFKEFHCVDELLFRTQLPDIIVISLSAELQDEALQLLRSRKLTSHSLIFVCHESALSPFLANAMWGADYDIQFQSYLIRRRRLKLEYQDDDNELKLISYLWLHGNKPLMPHSVPNKKQLYNYPLLKCWHLRSEESFQLLNQLQKRHWLQEEKLFNRVKFCPFCFSGHMNHLEVCPECKSANIHSANNLQCKACQHIGSSDSFKNKGSLSCPCCNKLLSNISEDYLVSDEEHECRDCGFNFVKAEPQIQCLHCHSLSPVDVPIHQDIYSYSLAPAGKTIVHHGHHYGQIEHELGQAMSHSQFYWLVRWQNLVAKRHNLNHMLLSISIDNLDMLMKSHGELIGLTMMNSLQQQLNTIIRKTDACSHYVQDGLLLFLPMTKEDDLHYINQRLFKMETVDKGEQLKLSVKGIPLPADIGEDIVIWIRQAFSEATSINHTV